MTYKKTHREWKLTRELLVIFLAGLFCALAFTFFMINRRFGAYAWVLEKGLLHDNRQAYGKWLKETAPDYSIKQPEVYMPIFEQKADDYIWLGLYDKQTGQYIESFFAKILESSFWGSWAWSDTDVAAQGMEIPVEIQLEFKDGTAMATLMSYQSVKFFAVYYLLIIFLDSSLVLCPILIFIHRRMKYLGQVRREAAVMGEGDMGHPVTIKGKDEISALASEFNSLRLALKISIENERQAYLDNQELIRALSHDIRTPLTSLNGYLEILKRKKGNPDNYPVYIQKCLEKTKELKDMTDQMFEYALVFENPGETVKEEYHFYRLAKEIKKQSEYLILQGFSVHLDLAEELPETVWMANPFLIQRLIANLCSNILRYGDCQEAVDVIYKKEEKGVSIWFVNGVSKKRQAAGSGVGLKSAEKIAAIHGGTLFYEENQREFRVKIYFPI